MKGDASRVRDCVVKPFMDSLASAFKKSRPDVEYRVEDEPDGDPACVCRLTATAGIRYIVIVQFTLCGEGADKGWDISLRCWTTDAKWEQDESIYSASDFHWKKATDSHWSKTKDVERWCKLELRKCADAIAGNLARSND